MINVKNRIAFLTGAAEGLGNAIARELGAAGMKLALFDRNGPALQALAKELRGSGVEVTPLVVDLAHAGATMAAADAALDAIGAPQVLVHNAAVLRQRDFAAVSYEDWRVETAVILQAAFLLSKAVWSPMTANGGGSIVYVSSGSALSGFANEVAYTPAKHGQEGLMKVLAIEGRAVNIAVNTVTTGAPIDTPMSASHYTAQMKVGIVPPSALAPAFRYLASLTADCATGQRFNAFQLSEAMRLAVGQPTYR